MRPDQPLPPTRRTVAKGALWSAPVVAVTTTMPAYTASATRPAPGLQGWVALAKGCSTSSTLAVDGVGAYPNRGLWIEGAAETTRAGSAALTYYLPSTLGSLTWTPQAGNGAWPTPRVDPAAPLRSGFTAYTTSYSGSWTFNRTNKILMATSSPSFSTRLDYSLCSRQITAYALRTVIVDNVKTTFARGPVSL